LVEKCILCGKKLKRFDKVVIIDFNIVHSNPGRYGEIVFFTKWVPYNARNHGELWDYLMSKKTMYIHYDCLTPSFSLFRTMVSREI
jgi:RNAse (barnase) inhibitor barstar